MKNVLLMILSFCGVGRAACAATPQWISAADAREATQEEKRDQKAPEGTSCFYRKIVNRAAVVKATAEVSALGVFDFAVNAQPVGDEVLAPGFTHAHKTKYYSTYDVTESFDRTPGATNVVSARVSTGWWNDKITGYLGKKSALWARITLAYADGTVDEIVTDETWRGCLDPNLIRAGIFDGEYYDARDPESAPADAPVVRNDEFKGEVLPQVGAKVVYREDLAKAPVLGYVWEGVTNASPTAYGTVLKTCVCGGREFCTSRRNVTVKRGQTLVLDFGQNAAAVPEFTASAAAGTKMTILPGEMLNDGNGARNRGCDGPEGSLYRVNLREIHRQGARVEYTFKGLEKETYRPRFTFFGYRYLSVTATDDVRVMLFKSVPVTSIAKDMERGTLWTGNEDVNRLISNVKWGMYSNYLSVPTDCPQRNERQGWTADTQVFAEAGSYLADTYDFFRKFMRDMRDTQSASGSYTGVAPLGEYGTAGEQRLGWSDCGIIVPYVMWRQTGRLDMLTEHWASMTRFMDWLKVNRYAKDQALNYQWADWLSCEDFESCSNQFKKDGAIRPEAALYWKYLGGCYWLMDARMMSEMAQALGKSEAAAAYVQMAAEALAYIRTEILEDGRIPAHLRHMQTPALFALHCGLLADDAEVAATKAALLQNIRDHGGCLQTGFLGTSILMDTLTEIGAVDVAYGLLLQHNNPSWLYSVDQGATTIWERWNSYRKDAGFGPVGMNSFNHYAYGAVLSWMFKTMAGIQAGTQPGFGTFVLAPIPDRRLGRVSAAYPTKAGVIRSAWKYDENGRCQWSFTVPAGARATVKVNGEEKVYGSGNYEMEIR